MAKMYELYSIMESMEAELKWIEDNASDLQKQKLADMVRTTADYGLTPEEAQAFWARKYDKAVYNAPFNRQWREQKKAQRKPTPTGEGWDAEHQLGTVKAKTAKKGSK